jgi:hypothetical protein
MSESMSQEAGRRHHGVTAKALKRALKKAGLKTSGSKRALTLRAKKAHVMAGGGSGATGVLSPASAGGMEGGRRRRSRRSRKHWPFM